MTDRNENKILQGKRINVVGTSGIGKSTFARKLSEITCYPYIELDALFWKPNWEETEDNEFFPLVEKKLSDPAWILDGNYSRTMPLKKERVEAIIWLDFSFSHNVYRCLKRSLARIISRKEFWPGTGNQESIRRAFFSRESIILWTLTTHHKRRKQYEKMMINNEFDHIEFYRLKSPKEAQQFLDDLQNNAFMKSDQQ